MNKVGDVSDRAKTAFNVMMAFPENLAVARTKDTDGNWVDVIVLIEKGDGTQPAQVTPLAIIIDKEMFKKLVNPMDLEEPDAAQAGAKVS